MESNHENVLNKAKNPFHRERIFYNLSLFKQNLNAWLILNYKQKRNGKKQYIACVDTINIYQGLEDGYGCGHKKLKVRYWNIHVNSIIL